MPSKRPNLRAALIGCGRMGARSSASLKDPFPAGWLPLSHAEAITSLPCFELVAVADTDADKARATAGRFSAGAWFTDYRKLIEETRPDILGIATRTEGRCEIIRFAAEHGVRGMHVENRLGRSLAECRQALEVAARHDVKLSYGATRRCMDVYRRAHQIIADGAIGRVTQITVEFGHASLLWSHPHSTDLLLFFSGCDEIKYLQATCDIPAGDVRGDLIDADPPVENACVHFANGVNGVITCATGMNVRIAGSDGNLVVAADGTGIEWRAKERPNHPYQIEEHREMPSTSLSGTQQAFRGLALSVWSLAPPLIRPSEIELSMGLLFGFVHSSLRGGRRISMTEIPGDLIVTGKQGAFYA